MVLMNMAGFGVWNGQTTVLLRKEGVNNVHSKHIVPSTCFGMLVLLTFRVDNHCFLLRSGWDVV